MSASTGRSAPGMNTATASRPHRRAKLATIASQTGPRSTGTRAASGAPSSPSRAAIARAIASIGKPCPAPDAHDVLGEDERNRDGRPTRRRRPPRRSAPARGVRASARARRPRSGRARARRRRRRRRAGRRPRGSRRASRPCRARGGARRRARARRRRRSARYGADLDLLERARARRRSRSGAAISGAGSARHGRARGSRAARPSPRGSRSSTSRRR